VTTERKMQLAAENSTVSWVSQYPSAVSEEGDAVSSEVEVKGRRDPSDRTATVPTTPSTVP
jgi:hypothetical protein